MYTVSSTAVRPNVLRIDGTLPVTAQSPSATNSLECSRAFFSFFKSSDVLTAPSTKVISTASGNSLISTSGEYTKSATSKMLISLSSMSRNDMWQPEQPSSQMVASFSLLIAASPASG